jgi:hypothetical protein
MRSAEQSGKHHIVCYTGKDRRWPLVNRIRDLSRSGYSIFTSSAYRTNTVKWRFPQEIGTLHDLAMSTSEVKVL